MTVRALGLFLLELLCSAGAALAAGHPLEISEPFRQALDTLRNGQYRQAIRSSRLLEESEPKHPLGPLIAAEAFWGLIYCRTGHINSREIWVVATVKESPYDEDFLHAVETALARSRGMQEAPESRAMGNFYEGLAHGVRARLYTLRAQALSSGREGARMRSALLEAVRQDARLQADAAAGLGLYDYYADVLSPLIKLFRFFLFLPGGDRQRGLAQLQRAGRAAELVGPEANYELAKIYSLRENRPAEALELFRNLADQYPGNAFFALATAQQAERTGQKAMAAAFAQRAAHAAGQMDEVCRERLGPAAQEAWERITQQAARSPRSVFAEP
ncbi:MAG TPA: hypothetical protein VNN17_02650 [Terriglobia bacterium]|nr:hypothetical protein [Terriglobia bacterium]